MKLWSRIWIIFVKFISFCKPGWVKLLDKKKSFDPRSNIPWLEKIISVIGVLRRIVGNWNFNFLWGSHLQSQVIVSFKFKHPGEWARTPITQMIFFNQVIIRWKVMPHTRKRVETISQTNVFLTYSSYLNSPRLHDYEFIYEMYWSWYMLKMLLFSCLQIYSCKSFLP